MCDRHWYRQKRYGTPVGGREIDHVDAFIEKAVRHSGEECLIWPFRKSRYGYGMVSRDGKRLTVSRIVCEKIYGPPPDMSMQAAHVCGNGGKACVAGSHLRWATIQGNHDDRKAHDTYGWKLKKSEVKEIRALAGSVPNVRIAEKFGVSPRCVGLIINRDQWPWLV